MGRQETPSSSEVAQKLQCIRTTEGSPDLSRVTKLRYCSQVLVFVPRDGFTAQIDDFLVDERSRVGCESVVGVQVLQTLENVLYVDGPPAVLFLIYFYDQTGGEPSHMCFMASTRNPATPKSMRWFKKAAI